MRSFLTALIAITLTMVGCEATKKLTPNIKTMNGQEILAVSSRTTATNLSWDRQYGNQQHCIAVVRGYLVDFTVDGYEATGTYRSNFTSAWRDQCEDGWKVRINLSAARK